MTAILAWGPNAAEQLTTPNSEVPANLAGMAAIDRSRPFRLSRVPETSHVARVHFHA